MFNRLRNIITNNNRGYIIVLVLIITSVLIAISSEFIISVRTHVHYMRRFDSDLHARYLALTGIHLARYILEADKKGVSFSMITGENPSSSIDCYQDFWALDFPEIPMEDGTLKLSVVDENSKININILANEFVDKTPYYGILQRFFLNMGLSMDFADIIMDWIDIDNVPFPYGAESSDFYLGLPSPYPAKNDAMCSNAEMLMLKNMTPEIYYGFSGGNSGLEVNLVEHNKGQLSISESVLDDMKFSDASLQEKKDNINTIPIGKEKSRALSDYLRTWGDRKDWTHVYNKININTASYRVLSALTDEMTDDVVTEIIRRRLEKPFTSVNEISEFISDDSVQKNILTTKSYIFSIVANATVRGVSVKITAVYNRDNRKFLYWSEN